MSYPRISKGKTHALYSLDEPLHLQILSSLASSIAKSQPEQPLANGHADHSEDVPDPRDGAKVITKGLPDVTATSKGVLLLPNGDEDADDEWVS